MIGRLRGDWLQCAAWPGLRMCRKAQANNRSGTETMDRGAQQRVVAHFHQSGVDVIFGRSCREAEMPLYTIALYQGERCAWQGSELAFPDDEEAVYRALSEYDWLCLDEDDPTPQEWRIEVWD